MLHADVICQMGRWLTGQGNGGAGGVENFAFDNTWPNQSVTAAGVLLPDPFIGLITGTFPASITSAATAFGDANAQRVDISTTSPAFWAWSEAFTAGGSKTSATLQNADPTPIDFTSGVNGAASGGHSIVGWAVYNVASGGTWRYCGNVNTITINAGDIPRFASGSLSWEIL